MRLVPDGPGPVTGNEHVGGERLDVGCKRIAFFRQTALLDRLVDPAEGQQQVHGDVLAR